jgi:DNA-binding CsgD family transcriptional regulator/tetratricopeptide (TPR) repeat protein
MPPFCILLLMMRITSPTIVGREHEWRHLRRALDRCRAGSGTVVGLVGEAGIGKSRLAARLIEAAEMDGLPVLTGRAVDSGTPVPFRALFEAVAGYVRDLDAAQDDPRLAAVGPALLQLVPDARPRDAEPYRASPMELAEAMLRLLGVVGTGHGCVVVLEDLHWADPDTIAVLEYLGDNIGSVPVACVVTLRPDPLSVAVRTMRALASRRAATVLYLERLTADELAEMTRSCLDTDEVDEEVDVFVRRFSDGLPFLVEELLGAVVGSGALQPDADSWRAGPDGTLVVPERFTDLVRRRLEWLPADAARVLVEAAVVAPRISAPLLQALTGKDLRATVELLHQGVAAQLLTVDEEDPQTFDFRHALTREAMVADLLPIERMEIARRALARLDTSDEVDADGELVVSLAEMAGDHQRAADVLLRAAGRAVEQGAFSSAAPMLDRAIEHATVGTATWHRIGVLLVEVLTQMGEITAALELGRDVVAEARGGAAAPVHLAIARAAVAGNRLDEADAAIDAARRTVGVSTEPSHRATIELIEARVAQERYDLEGAITLVTSAMELAQQTEDHGLVGRALEVLAECTLLRGDPIAAKGYLDRMVEVGRAHGLAALRVRGTVQRAIHDAWRGSGSSQRFAVAREEAIVAGALVAAAHLDNYQAWVAKDRWDTDEAEAAALRCLDLARRFRIDGLIAAALTVRATTAAQRGDRHQMERLLAEAARTDGDNPIVVATASTTRASYWCRRDDLERLSEELEIAIKRLRVTTAASPERALRVLFCVLEDRDGDTALAELDAGPARGHFAVEFYRHHAIAVALGRAGDADGALDQLRLAASCGQSAWVVHHTRRLIAEAAMTDGWGDPVGWLREAEPFFVARGHDEIAAGCRRLLTEAGSPLPRRRRVEEEVPADLRAHGVTAREAQVLALLAEARSTREIAALLFISPKTVERHTANLAAKLDLDGRAAVVAFGAARAAAGQ